MTDPDLTNALAILRDPATIRSRSEVLLAHAVAGRSAFFTVDLERLPEAARYVARVIRDAYPSLEIPYHARWRHFSAAGRDRWSALAAEFGTSSADGSTRPDAAGSTRPDATGSTRPDAAEIARIRFDLCVVSVLLDAGAGPDWRFLEPGTGDVLARSEGLAVASLHAFRAGLFSGDGKRLRADAAGLARVTPETLGQAFQVTPDNPLEGLAGRAALLRSLAAALTARPDLFGPEARVGKLYDALTRISGAGRIGAIGAASGSTPAIPATAILAAVLDGFGPAWPERLSLGGHSLGDVWHHPAVEGPGRTNGLIPFHKLSQWLTYSLVEVLEDAGLRVTGLDELTGLPEYRNGGLFLDLHVVRLRDPSLAARSLPVSHPAIVEWRALTVALLDRIADPIRVLLDRTSEQLPLARILEGGTWAAGRRIAHETRPGGGPPLSVLSDGTVF